MLEQIEFEPQRPRTAYVRKKPLQVVPVCDLNEGGTPIGRMRNLTPRGMKIIADYDIPVGSLYEVSFELCDADDHEHRFDTFASCVWCDSRGTDTYAAGFEFLTMSDGQKTELKEIYATM